MAAFTVALLGGESSGKTTLGLALTRQLNALGVSAVLVPEHLRAWCEREGRAPLGHEQAGIAATQSRLIETAASGGAEVVVADTIGSASPAMVKHRLAAIAQVLPLDQVAVHLHDTRGMAVANACCSASTAFPGAIWSMAILTTASAR